MAKAPMRSKKNQESAGEEMFAKADKMLESGDSKSAFELFLAAAKTGHKASQLNVGYCYDIGSGTPRNRSSALYWYRRAYRQGDAQAANNIGTIYRDARNPQAALRWFRRAVSLGNEGSNLEIAKYYLLRRGDPGRAIMYLKKVCQSRSVSEAEEGEAKELLSEANNRLQTR